MEITVGSKVIHKGRNFVVLDIIGDKLRLRPDRRSWKHLGFTDADANEVTAALESNA